MKIDKLYFSNNHWMCETSECVPGNVDIVFVFGDIDAVEEINHAQLLHERYPNAHVVGASTAGNILDDALSDASAIAVAICFEKGHVAISSVAGLENGNLPEKASALIEGLPKEGLRHIFILSEGMNINSSELVKAVNALATVPVTGGLAGDGRIFDHTVVFADGPAEQKRAVAIGLYGSSIHVGIGCKAGWEEFGAERVVTRSEGNVIYEIDHKPAIELYEKYLGEYINDLPRSGLLFPLNVKEYEGDHEVIRVMMGINEDNSLLFAGDIPQGSIVRLMKTNIDNLVDGSILVANTIKPYNDRRSLILTVSCSGRLSVLKQMADAEVQVIQEVFGENAQVAGFYSYGEIAPFSDDVMNCKLHNQTMTLTVIYEE